MSRKLKNFVVGVLTVNAVGLFCVYSTGVVIGNYKGKQILKEEMKLDNENSNFNFSDFEKKLEEFKKNYPEYFSISEKGLSRDENINKLQQEKLDILIIGGGSSGAGVLLEAHERGYKAGLIEARDFACGSSSRSTKLAHGGIRYLQDVFIPGTGKNLEKFRLVEEALVERDFILNSCPFMNDQVQIKIPYSNIFKFNYYYAGVWLYYLLYLVNKMDGKLQSPHAVISPPAIFPKSKEISFFEGQMFDSRQNLLSILNCKKSAFANYVEFKEYKYNYQGKIIGIKAYDTINKKEIEIDSSLVVNCTGVMGDDYLSKNDPLSGKLITTSKGAHIVVDKELFNESKIKSGYMLPNTSDGRILFILPYQRNYYLIGTTETEMEKNNPPFADDADVDYIFNELKTALKIDDVTLKKHIKSQWAGLRPLVREPTSNSHVTKSIARNHVIRTDSKTGLVSLLGGKWTTYRRMGQDVMNEIREKKLLGEDFNYVIESNLNTKLPGAISYVNIKGESTFKEEKQFFLNLESYLVEKYNIDRSLVQNLIFKYGLNTLKVLNIDKELKLGGELVSEGKNKIMTAEMVYSMRNEMVVKPNDFICRRTGLAFVDFEAAEKAVDKVSETISKETKWSADLLSSEKSLSKTNLKYFI